MTEQNQLIFSDALLDIIPEALLVLLPLYNSEKLDDLKIIKINHFGRELLQLPVEQSSNSFKEIVGEGIWSKMNKQFAIALDKENMVKASFSLGKKELKRWFEYKTIYKEGHIMLSIIEVTSRKLREKALKASESRYRMLFEESMDSIFIMNNEHLILEMNQAMIAFTGFHVEDVHSMTLESLFADHDDFWQLNKILYKSNRVEEFEATLRLADGKETTCLINLVELNQGKKKVPLYQGVIKDITKRRQAEHEMIVAEKLSMTGKLARSIAHEVRNPLTNLNLSLEQLRDEIDSVNNDAELYLDIIARNAIRIEELISSLLESAKPKALNFQKANVNSVIESSIELIKDRLLLKKLELKKDLSQHLPEIGIDKDQLEIALVNLMINAIEAMDEGGQLKVSSFTKAEDVYIQVADDGAGISEAHQEQLFDPFFSAKKAGTGLGLTSVQNIIKSHHGNITCESELGKGTTFTLHFPH